MLRWETLLNRNLRSIKRSPDRGRVIMKTPTLVALRPLLLRSTPRKGGPGHDTAAGHVVLHRLGQHLNNLP